MVASVSAVVALKMLFIVLACIMLVLASWAFGTDGLLPCVDLRIKWVIVTLINFYINLGVILAWIVYKESNWIMVAVLIPAVLFAGSTITSPYIALQFFKLSPEESSKDPLYFVLVRNQVKDDMGYRRGPSVLTARVIISALGPMMLGTFIYVLITDGSPFRSEIISRCMIATTTDIYCCIVTLSVWVAYKESSWMSAFFWILSLVFFGGIATSVYIVRQLFYLSTQQSVSLVLFNDSNRDLLSSDPLLMAYTDA